MPQDHVNRQSTPIQAGRQNGNKFDSITFLQKGPTLTNANGRIDTYYAFPIVTISKEKGSPIVKDTFKLATFAGE